MKYLNKQFYKNTKAQLLGNSLVKNGQSTNSWQKGFTIIELMIATAVLSTMILVVTIIMINIGNLFDKGVNQAKTQDAVRDITDQLSNDLKFYPGQVVPGSANEGTIIGNGVQTLHNVTVSSYCIGTVRYSYIIGYKLGSSGSVDGLSPEYPTLPGILWRDSNPGGAGSCVPVNITSSSAIAASEAKDSGTELAPAGTRLTYFAIDNNASPLASPYTIGLAYGDYDLLIKSGLYTPGDVGASPTDITCKGNTGDQFCATAGLSTVVVQRIQ
jgi:prepilin-type N-terminal cleavage/methylation domain-containing protein